MRIPEAPPWVTRTAAVLLGSPCINVCLNVRHVPVARRAIAERRPARAGPLAPAGAVLTGVAARRREGRPFGPRRGCPWRVGCVTVAFRAAVLGAIEHLWGMGEK